MDVITSQVVNLKEGMPDFVCVEYKHVLSSGLWL